MCYLFSMSMKGWICSHCVTSRVENGDSAFVKVDVKKDIMVATFTMPYCELGSTLKLQWSRKLGIYKHEHIAGRSMEVLSCWASKPFVNSSMGVLSYIVFLLFISGFKKPMLIPLNLHMCASILQNNV